MNKQEAIAIRLHNQQLIAPQYHNPADIVAWMGAMQAQDYNFFRWAIGIRQRAPKLDDIVQSFASASLLRLHLLRCTVQVVAPDDVHWLVALCKERNLRAVQSWYNSTKTVFPQSYFKEAIIALKELLTGGKSLTKEDISVQLTHQQMLPEAHFINPLLLQGEIEGILCSGAMNGKRATWALLSERAPQGKALTTDEALERLARKYFRSHSPASIADFAWYSGLPITQCRKAIEKIAPEIEEIVVEDEPMYLYRNAFPMEKITQKMHLLPPYDEYLIGYKSRWISLEKKHEAKAHNNFGIFKSVILHEGRVVGNWKASIDGQGNNLSTELFTEKTKVKKTPLKEAVQQFLDFCKE
ncbi:MAG: winged helix DNA-binding domain-containing protein [Capnocytophaga sp.]|nr:winged helix DNA-binding domain-containing protein [Capnocytophaga sp.]